PTRELWAAAVTEKSSAPPAQGRWRRNQRCKSNQVRRRPTGARPRLTACSRIPSPRPFVRPTPGARVMLSRPITAVLAVAAGLAFGSVGCNRTPPNGQAESSGKPGMPPWFEDVTDAVGLNFTHNCGPTGTYFMPQSMYGGVAVFDADGDGRLDILL